LKLSWNADAAIVSAGAQSTLRVGDQKGNSQAVMEAAGVLKGNRGFRHVTALRPW